ncbi:NUDIX domain-containing protein [soil metagenome]
MNLADWVATQRTRADRPPLRPRARLMFDAATVIGSIEPTLADRMHAAGLPLRRSHDAWLIDSPHDPSLERIALWLEAHRLGSRWRNELLSVTDEAANAVAEIERAAVRPLGITTHAVHLIAGAPNGDAWVQQRALDKSTDPGLWDTTMGGLISAGESILRTLARETWEEAGLHIESLHDVAPRGSFTVRRPIDSGYMVERIHVFRATVPEGLVPLNQDGEVAAFERVTPEALTQRLIAGQFTLEAGLILADGLLDLA